MSGNTKMYILKDTYMAQWFMFVNRSGLKPHIWYNMKLTSSCMFFGTPPPKENVQSAYKD